jgi:hypothetical protein
MRDVSTATRCQSPCGGEKISLFLCPLDEGIYSLLSTIKTPRAKTRRAATLCRPCVILCSIVSTNCESDTDPPFYKKFTFTSNMITQTSDTTNFVKNVKCKYIAFKKMPWRVTRNHPTQCKKTLLTCDS